MHGFAVYVKERLPFAQDLSLKTLQILNYVFDWLYFTQCLTFFLYQPPSSSLCTIFYSISSNIDEVFSINTSANVFALETLTSTIRTGLPILAELIDLVNSVIIFLSRMTLPRWLTFLLRFRTVILIVLLFWIYFFFSDASICSTSSPSKTMKNAFYFI